MKRQRLGNQIEQRYWITKFIKVYWDEYCSILNKAERKLSRLIVNMKIGVEKYSENHQMDNKVNKRGLMELGLDGMANRINERLGIRGRYKRL